MATTEKYDEIILQKQKQIDKLQERINIYNKEIDNVIIQLSEKRHELNDLARTSLSSLQSKIPELEKSISDKSKELTRLDMAIVDAQEQYSREEKSCSEKYAVLENSLKDKYSKLQEELNSKISVHNEKESTVNSKAVDVNAAALVLEKEKNELVNREELLSQQIDAFQKEQESFLNDLHAERKKLLEKEKLIDSTFSEMSERGAELNDREAKIVEAENEVQRIVKISIGLDARESALNNKADELSKKEVELNTANVKIISEHKRLGQKEEFLKILEDKIKKREENLRIAESSFVDKAGV